MPGGVEAVGVSVAVSVVGAVGAVVEVVAVGVVAASAAAEVVASFGVVVAGAVRGAFLTANLCRIHARWPK